MVNLCPSSARDSQVTQGSWGPLPSAAATASAATSHPIIIQQPKSPQKANRQAVVLKPVDIHQRRQVALTSLIGSGQAVSFSYGFLRAPVRAELRMLNQSSGFWPPSRSNEGSASDPLGLLAT